MKKVLSFLMSISMILCGVSFCGANSNVYADETQLERDAEILYLKIHAFLILTEDYFPADFDRACVDYMLRNSGTFITLDKEDFETQTKSDLHLYKGVPKKELADNFKSGKNYIEGGLRGRGLYTTTSLSCASHYTEVNGEVITLSINKDANIMEMSYLTEVLLKMQDLHKKEFTFSASDLVYDSMQNWTEDQVKKCLKDDYKKFLDGSLTEEEIKSVLMGIKESEEYKNLSKTRKRYYRNKKAAVFYNFGLLAKLLGYDALHSMDFLSPFANEKEEEYLILNAGVLKVCK